jgi:uncharacterized protein (TIGR02246 family)
MLSDLQPNLDDTAITAIAAAWEVAWNTHNIAAMAALVAPDVDFINVTGRWLQGAGEFRSWHDRIHRSHLRASRWITRAVAVRRLQPGLALAHIQWTIAGERTQDDAAGPDRSGIFTWLMQQRGERWQIAAAHNTNLGDGVDDHRAHARSMS